MTFPIRSFRAALLCAALACAAPFQPTFADAMTPSTAPSPDRQALPVVVFIATGGTIAMKVDPATGGVVPAISGDDLMQSVPEAAAVARIDVQEFSKMSANYITNGWWARLTQSVERALARPEVAGVVVAQGTDTMEETAWWLDLTVGSDKPVVLIGAQRNASSKDFDGPRNLLGAIRIAVAPEARGNGVMVAMNNQINAARSVTKTHTANVETFQGGGFGWLGEVWDDRVVFSRAPLRRQHFDLHGDVDEAAYPQVHIFPMYAGADGRFIRHAVDTGAKGIVVQAVGMGNMNVSMFEAVKYAIAHGVPVVVATRVPNGRTMPVYGFEGGGRTSFDAGAIMAGDLSAQKAKVLLTLLLHAGVHDTAALREAFAR